MLRKALVILSGNAAVSLLTLARNLIVARMIPVADFGIAATFALAMAVVEMASAFGLQQQIVQSKEGDDPRFQAALQGFQVMRGVMSGVILFLLAGPMARFMGIPEVIWAYQILAIVPVLNALVHFDIYRLNRQMRFGPMLLTGAIPATVSLALIWPLLVWFGDWRVMLWSIIAQAVVTVATSHLVAERPFRLVWSSTVVAGTLRFGWPLLINGILMFLVFQGDKLIVGRLMGMEALAIFAMGVTLTLTPTLVLAKSAQNLFLPRLSTLFRDATVDKGFERLAYATLQASILNGALIVLVITLLGEYLVAALLGTKYEELLELLPAFALLSALRVFKAGPNVVALAVGQTGNAMISNLPRVLALPLVWYLLVSGATLEHILWLGALAETLGYLLALLLVRSRPGLPLRHFLPVVLATGLFLVACGLHGNGVASGPPWSGPLMVTATFLLLLVTLRSLRRDIFGRLPKI